MPHFSTEKEAVHGCKCTIINADDIAYQDFKRHAALRLT